MRRIERKADVNGRQAPAGIGPHRRQDSRGAPARRPLDHPETGARGEIILERHANSGRFEKRIAAIDEVVECWEVSGTVDYMARFVCADLAAYEELTSVLIDDENLGVARIVSHVALRPVRRFTGYPDALLARKPAKS